MKKINPYLLGTMTGHGGASELICVIDYYYYAVLEILY